MASVRVLSTGARGDHGVYGLGENAGMGIAPGTPAPPHRIGVVVHPSRDLGEAIRVLREWAASSGGSLVQVWVPRTQQRVADEGEAADCDLIVAIGGDGTALVAIQAAARVERPVLGVACGSLGVLTSVAVKELAEALERVDRGDWIARAVPALDVLRDGDISRAAFNDVAIVRSGDGQVRATAYVDGVLFARLAGDGCIVSTPMGSSAYSLAAGGTLVTPGVPAFLLTPLSAHAGSCPPLVIGAGSELRVDVAAGFGGGRVEIDGHVVDDALGTLTFRLRDRAATIVGFSDQEPYLTGLRRRQIVSDSPRILAEDEQLE
jgi:NAD+ kinase